MFNDPVLTVVNCVLIAGIVAALLASVFIKRGTQELKAVNAARPSPESEPRNSRVNLTGLTLTGGGRDGVLKPP